jgi:Bacterial Ig-like domain (group 2)
MKCSIFSVAVLFACGAPTDTNRLDVPTSVDFRIVHPAVVRVTVTPANGNAYPAGKVPYVAVARDGRGRLLRASAWKWSSSDTTVAVVSSTGLATARAVGTGVITAVAYPPWRR